MGEVGHMIVGRGDIASVLTDRPDRIWFASGVSNSREARESEYHRELELLLKQDTSKHLVYFSSLSVFYSTGRYANHKWQMEALVKSYFRKHTIVRIGNITWGTNPHTLINYIRKRIEEHKPVEIQNAYRYLIDKDEFLYWLGMIPDWPCEMNITGKRMKVSDIVKEYCHAVQDAQACARAGNATE